MKQPIKFVLNDKIVETVEHPAKALLDIIRERYFLTGTKEGCREGDCGACTVLVGYLVDDEIQYKSVNSCLTPIAAVDGKHIVTIEGLNLKDKLTTLQNEFVEQGASQCGFCTPGFIVSLTGWLLQNKNFSADEALTSIDGNICRCTGYASIIRAVEKIVAEIQKTQLGDDKISTLIRLGFLPQYFIEMPKLLKELRNASPGSDHPYISGTMVSGGTDLLVQRWDSIVDEEVYIKKSNGKFENIFIEEDSIVIKGETTISDLMKSEIIKEHIPKLSKWFSLFGSEPIRNKATITGNIVNASPIADSTNLLLVLDAELKLKKEKSTRSLPLSEFFISYKKVDLLPGEHVDAIHFEIPEIGTFIGWEKISKRKYLDIASINSSCCIKHANNKINMIRISAGGVAPIPLLLKKTSQFLEGKEITFLIADEILDIIDSEITPISDARGSAQYKAELLKRLVLAHLKNCFPHFMVEELI